MVVTKRLGLAGNRPRQVALAVGAALLVWVLFFDSHSLVKRIAWTFEARTIDAENTALRAEIEQLKTDIERAEDAVEVERVAREDYGMRRSGETVYRVEISSE